MKNVLAHFTLKYGAYTYILKKKNPYRCCEQNKIHSCLHVRLPILVSI